MFSNDQYRLLDFGAGRRLERFGTLVLDRPCPGAEGIRRGAPSLWNVADARFVEQNDAQNSDENRRYCNENRLKNGVRSTSNNGDALGFRGVWRPLSELGRQFFDVETKIDRAAGQTAETLSSRPWTIAYSERFAFELKGSPFGHVGVFPEQAENWDRIFDLCREGAELLDRPTRVLNLFGYTGGSALAAAAAGAETTHLDAARNIVAQARRNAVLSFPILTGSSKLTDSNVPNAGESIRWIVDDAVKFVKREIKRGVFYDGIVLDPPSYGHGARGEVWRISRDLTPLLQNCAKILTNRFSFVLLTCHSPRFEAPTLERLLETTFRERFDGGANGACDSKIRRVVKPLELLSERNGALPAGDLALFVRKSSERISRF